MTRHLAIIGPTASGKSALAHALTRAVPGVEVVSLDSMQVYRGMDIGTAKPSAAERAAIPHHLIDVADPDEEWSVRATQAAARAAISQIEARGGRALLVGGTGLYVRAVVDALRVPATDSARRAALESETLTDDGLRDAYARLAGLDATAASRIEPGNRRRIVRALEVIELTGRPFSSFGPGLAAYGPPALDVTMVGLDVPRDELARRISERFGRMIAAGLVDEVRALAARSRGLSRTARHAIGYREMLGYLEGGVPSLDDAVAEAVRRTRRFARRQQVWFARDPRVVWLDGREKPGDLEGAALGHWEHTPAVSIDRTA